MATGCRGMDIVIALHVCTGHCRDEANHVHGGTQQPDIHGLYCIFTMWSTCIAWSFGGCYWGVGLHHDHVLDCTMLVCAKQYTMLYSGKSHLPPSFKLVICTVYFICTCSLGRSVEEVGQAGVSWSGQCREDYPLEYAKGRQNGTTCAHTASKYVSHLVYSDGTPNSSLSTRLYCSEA